MGDVEYLEMVPETMKAVVAHGPGDYRLDEVPVPAIGDGEVLIKIDGCGICGSDVKVWHGAPSIWGGPGQDKYIDEPVVVGHEFSGEVVGVGRGAAEVHGVKLGDRVAPEQIIPCGRCRYCRETNYHLCQVNHIFGSKKGICDGGMAEYCRLPRNTPIHRLPEGFPPRFGPYMEPLGCAIHGVELTNIQFWDVVVVAGMGPVGLGMLQAAALKNPKLLIAVDMRDKRLDIAGRLGAQLTFNPGKTDAVKEILNLTGGYGCDIYIHATGSPKGVLQGLDMVKKGGTYLEYSVFGDLTSCDWSIIGDRKEITVRGGHLSPKDSYASGIRFIMDGRVKVDEIITNELPLADFEKGLKLMEKGDECIKIILQP